MASPARNGAPQGALPSRRGSAAAHRSEWRGAPRSPAAARGSHLPDGVRVLRQFSGGSRRPAGAVRLGRREQRSAGPHGTQPSETSPPPPQQPPARRRSAGVTTAMPAAAALLRSAPPRLVRPTHHGGAGAGAAPLAHLARHGHPGPPEGRGPAGQGQGR